MTLCKQIEKVSTYWKATTMKIEIRECLTFEELTACVQLQRDVFGLPEIEISPVRHLIVTKHAGGFTMGAFAERRLVGFVLSVPAVLHGENAYYSHMTAVDKEFQSFGIGAKLKWAQRERALAENVKFIKWTFHPMQARNAFFNLEKLGAIIRHYEPNFYGTDYPDPAVNIGLDSDRHFAEWHLDSAKVAALSEGKSFTELTEAKLSIEIPNDWSDLIKRDLKQAVEFQNQVKNSFQKAFSDGLICRSFQRDDHRPKYLLF